MKLDPKRIVDALQELVKEYNFTPEEVYNVVKMWIKTAFRRDYLNKNKRIELDMIIDKSWKIKVYRVYHVIDDNEEITDPEKQIHLSDAKKEKEDVQVGEDLLIDITPENLEFSRIAAQSAAQTIKQQVKKIEKERFYRTFADSEWDILTGKVKYVQWDIVVLEFNWENTVILPPEGQIKGKTYEVGEEIKVLLKQIRKQGSDIILEITQSAPEFIEALMKKYIPEIENWTVQIVKVARIPWVRSKVLVKSDDERVDPVWVCVGEWASRISMILDELDGEKLDIIEYVDDKEQLIRNIFAPAKINKIEENDNNIEIYADESQKPLLFGRKAVNVKLASQLLWKRILIK
jgi:N utilization substance protein A